MNSQLQKLITTLGEDFELTGEEIADILWLTAQRHKYNGTLRENLITDSEAIPELPSKDLSGQNLPPATPLDESISSISKKSETAPIYPENSPSNSQVLPIRVPDAPSLREPLKIAQALRPLMGNIASGRKVILDEIATAKRIAETKIYLPILKSETELWLDLALVIDESKSMIIWGHTIKELKRLVEHYGIFRDVRIWGLVTDETGEVKLVPRLGTKTKEKRFASHKELIDPNGRRLIIIVSDCVSSHWYNGAIIPVLKAWSQRQPLAILQMLPEWLWLRTGLGNGASVLLKSLAPGAANQRLQIEELLLRKDFEIEEGIKIPVFNLEPELKLDSEPKLKLALAWSEMVRGKRDASASGFVFPSQLELDEEILPETEVIQLDAQGRITRFRQTASPIARKLAGLLAAAPVINLPVVRIIQDTLLPQSNQIHVAEVFLGGLLKPLNTSQSSLKRLNPPQPPLKRLDPPQPPLKRGESGENISDEADINNPDAVQYDFMDDGIREIFLKDAPVRDSAEVFDAVSQYFARKLNKSLEDFVALLKAPVSEKEQEEGMIPFAEIAIKILRGLGGAYARFADELVEHTNY